LDLKPKFESNPSIHKKNRIFCFFFHQNLRKFGFVKYDAIQNGATGRDCCGEEHEVKLIWSITSGKQRLLFDNNQVHYSKLGFGARQKGEFTFHWKSLGLDLAIKAYAAPPIRQTEDWKQFDLTINGQSFDDYLPIFQLGKEPAEIPNDDFSEIEIENDVFREVENDAFSEGGNDLSAVISFESKEDESQDENEENTHTQSHQSPSDFIADFDSMEDDDFVAEFDAMEDDKSDQGIEVKGLQFNPSFHHEEEDDNISTIETLLEQKHLSDEVENDGIQINPNEPPSFEALNNMNQIHVKNEKEKETNLSYDEVWGNVFDPFELNAPDKTNTLGGTSENSERSKQKTKVTNSPQSVIEKGRTISMRSFTRRNFLSPCIDSFTRPSKIKAESETVHNQPKYEEMESNNEPIF
jgi:hypothetical protein